MALPLYNYNQHIRAGLIVVEATTGDYTQASSGTHASHGGTSVAHGGRGQNNNNCPASGLQPDPLFAAAPMGCDACDGAGRAQVRYRTALGSSGGGQNGSAGFMDDKKDIIGSGINPRISYMAGEPIGGARSRHGTQASHGGRYMSGAEHHNGHGYLNGTDFDKLMRDTPLHPRLFNTGDTANHAGRGGTGGTRSLTGTFAGSTGHNSRNGGPLKNIADFYENGTVASQPSYATFGWTMDSLGFDNGSSINQSARHNSVHGDATGLNHSSFHGPPFGHGLLQTHDSAHLPDNENLRCTGGGAASRDVTHFTGDSMGSGGYNDTTSPVTDPDPFGARDSSISTSTPSVGTGHDETVGGSFEDWLFDMLYTPSSTG